MDESTKTLGWSGTDVTVTNGFDAKGDGPNEGRTEIHGGVTKLDCVMDATPDII